MRIKVKLTSLMAACLLSGLTIAQDEFDSSSCSNFERYRSYNGRCNNLGNPDQGATNDVQQRMLPSEYDDPSISSPRSKSIGGVDLPSPRTVSQIVHTNMASLDPKFTLMLMQWGQFIDHDLTFTPHIEGNECEGVCENSNPGTCFPITIKSGDSFFNQQCFPFTRSKPSSGIKRNQTNTLTSYLDASMVYGNSESKRNELREAEPRSHRLKVLIHTSSSRGLLPTKGSKCSSVMGYCFLAGDIRVNEHPGLTATHTIFVREHNRIADSLANINPHWEVNRVFEETRRIISAQIQHITYNEFLPHVLGPLELRKHGLDLQTSGYYIGYNESCSATSFNEFSTAAFRFGHSMIPPNLAAISKEDVNQIRELPLKDHFNNPDILLEPNSMDDLLRGLTMVQMQPVDRFLTEEITNHLFENKTVPKSGMDLTSLNIQRGRDHGLPGYNKYRELCNLPKAQEFSDLNGEMTDDTITKLKEAYSNVDDIDLFTGLLSEIPLSEAIIGPTLACIIGLQFKHIRQCDQYWYETSDPKKRFTKAQLQELRTSNLAAVICKNMDLNSKFSRSPMRQVDNLVDCEKDIRSIDLEAWRESEGYSSAGNVHNADISNIYGVEVHNYEKEVPTTTVRPECVEYNVLSEKSRSVNYPREDDFRNCDRDGFSDKSRDWNGQGWYRLAGAAGSRIPETSQKYKHCGTTLPGWVNGVHPTKLGASKHVLFCFGSSINECRYSSHGKITNCGDFYVYNLKNVPTCSVRICGTN